MSLRRIPGALLLLIVAASAAAQTPVLGPQFQVNTYTTEFSRYAHVAMNEAGDFVVCWQRDQGAIPIDSYEQFYPATGPQPPETEIDTETAAIRWFPTAAVGQGGDFVVAWTTNTTPGTAQYYAVRYRRFDNTGAPLSAPAPIVSGSGFGLTTQVGVMAGGDFVVIWDSSVADGTDTGVAGQRFDANGNTLGGVFHVNSFTTGVQNYPSLAHDAAGNFVVAWGSNGQDGDDYGVFAQRFDASGAKVGPEFQVNSYTTGAQWRPSAGMDAAGNFVVVWESGVLLSGSYDIRGQRFDAAGNTVGGEFQINASSVAYQWEPNVAMDPAGSFLVVWSRVNDVAARQFSANGVALGAEFEVMPNVTVWPRVAAGSNGEAIVVGQELGNVYARRVSLEAGQPMAVDAHGDGTTSNLNGVLEPGESVQVEPAWKKISGAAFTGLASNLTGPPGPIYTLEDAGATYSSLDPAGTVVDCFHTSGDCYRVAVSGPRPASHWDATFDEVLDNGYSKAWSLHVGESFPDVPPSDGFYAYIETLLHNGITGGCGGDNYCPGASVTRGQMAVFLLKAGNGSNFVPPPCSGVFDDVTCPSLFADWIEELATEGITGGCGGNHYCPDQAVTRAQMAVFLLKARHGSAYAPPVCQGLFGDVTCPSQFADWIEELAAEQITSGCGGGNYCPSNPNTRGQMAVFLVRTFGLQLYGP